MIGAVESGHGNPLRAARRRGRAPIERRAVLYGRPPLSGNRSRTRAAPGAKCARHAMDRRFSGGRHAGAALVARFAVRAQGQDRGRAARPRRPDRDRRRRHGDPGDSMRRQNPLGKIPALVLEDGAALFDSRGHRRISRLARRRRRHHPGRARGQVPRADAAGARRRDHGRRAAPGLRSALARAGACTSRNGSTTRATRSHAGSRRSTPRPPAQGARDIGAIALACALGYLDLRFAGAWRADHPRLVAWLDGFAAAVPAFEATRVKA